MSRNRSKIHSFSSEDALTTTEIGEVQEFLTGLKLNAGLEFDEEQEVQKEHFRHVQKFVSRLRVNDRNHLTPYSSESAVLENICAMFQSQHLLKTWSLFLEPLFALVVREFI